MIVLIDNYDSFSYNIVQYLSSLGAEVRVVRNDSHTPEAIIAMQPDGIVLSPGAGTPRQAGMSPAVVQQAVAIPIFGVCLGMQVVAECFGSRVEHAACGVMHGKTSRIRHDGLGVFSGLPQDFRACRYHSLAVASDTVPDCLSVTATAEDGTLMGLRHRTRPVEGVQFHPEAILSEHGLVMMQNFLNLCAEEC
ncbi:MAG: aminodeoxychorismate/anthranilate synthase component II [Alphaproteobacteria bacterium]|nr:aminodeoxychorismate/anthranilate synthase component II [Alphaproteobacteria bacterium]